MQITISTIIGILILGIFAGLLSGLVGIGGGIVIVPALVIFFGLSQQTAQGTTLAMLSLPVSLAGALSYYRNEMLDWKVALLLAIGFVVGGYFGGKIAVDLPAHIVKKVFGVLLIIIAFKLIFIDKK